MKRSIFLLILISLIAVLYLAGSQTITGSSQACKSTLVIHSTPNTTGSLYLNTTSQPFLTNGNGDYTYTDLCPGAYTVCVDGTGYYRIDIDGTERTYEVTVDNGEPCPY
jgi:hypothetical protein